MKNRNIAQWARKGLPFLCLLLCSCAVSSDYSPSGPFFGDPFFGDRAYETLSSGNSSFGKAHSFYLRGRHERAEEIFTDLIRSRDTKGNDALIASAYRFRGECKKSRKKYGQARFDFEMAIKIAKAAFPPIEEAPGIITDCRILTGDSYMHEGAFRKADTIYSDLLSPADLSEAQRDSVLYRRYICAVKLNSPDPESFTRQIQNSRNFDEKGLARTFLRGGTASPYFNEPNVANDPVPPPTSGPLVIRPRATWGARNIKENVTPMTLPTKITLHHTGVVFEGMGEKETAARILTHQVDHQDRNGWADIGYHFLVDRAGRVWEGRLMNYQGAHAGNSALNKGNIGISVLGNYDQQKLGETQKVALVKLMRALCQHYHIPISQVHTHLEFKATCCPGRDLQRFIDGYRQVVL